MILPIIPYVFLLLIACKQIEILLRRCVPHVGHFFENIGNMSSSKTARAASPERKKTTKMKSSEKGLKKERVSTSKSRSESRERLSVKDKPTLSKADDSFDKRVQFPYEILTGKLLTHYDETAGVAIPNTSVDQHRGMGNTVVPLVEAYRSRYDHLRMLLTTKLLPKREYLLQIRRQLLNTAAEVTAVRKGIERETMQDAEQIIERLRGTESLRQSSITHEVGFCY